MFSKDKKILVLLSGGQDSTTCLYWARENFNVVTALIIDYGQRHRIEIQSAKKIAKLAKVPFIEQKISLFSDIKNSLLLHEPGSGHIEYNHPRHPDLPASFVPGRNIFFILTAIIIAEKREINNLVTGVCQTDYSGYPDCRRPVINALENLSDIGIEHKIKIHTPLMDLTKKETVELAFFLPGCWEALAYSHTCYEGQYPPCGKCPSCLLRTRGFEEAKRYDPIFSRHDYESELELD